MGAQGSSSELCLLIHMGCEGRLLVAVAHHSTAALQPSVQGSAPAAITCQHEWPMTGRGVTCCVAGMHSTCRQGACLLASAK